MIKQFLLFICILLTAGCDRPSQSVASAKIPERIISLSPNITDTLCDLGLEDRLVGISRFSNRIPETDLPIVGDFMNINYETIVTLRPDLVIFGQGADTQQARLESLGIPYLETGSLTLAEVLQTVRDIGDVCGVPEDATALIQRFNERVRKLRYEPAHRPRTLLAFGEFTGSGEVEQVYAFGAGCIHSELLNIVGGENVIKESRPSVLLSREAIIRYNPEIIIELTVGGPANHWDSLPSLDAVRQGNIHVLDGDYTCIPSPNSLMQTLQDFSMIIRQNDLEAE